MADTRNETADGADVTRRGDAPRGTVCFAPALLRLVTTPAHRPAADPPDPPAPDLPGGAADPDRAPDPGPVLGGGPRTATSEPGVTRYRGGTQAPRRRFRTRVLGLVATVAVVVAAAALVKAYVADAYYIPSTSMLPGLHVDDRIVVSRLAYDLHPVHRGDVVVFDAPAGVLPAAPPEGLLGRIGTDLGLVDTSGVLVKRVIGLPGDTVEGREGRVFVDGELLLEPYLAPGTLTSDFGPVKVPAGHLWVMGDNRGDSEDSRVFGPVPESSVVGRAVWRVWPLPRLAFLTLRPAAAR